MSQDKTIGRVLSVDNFRVYIKIDEELYGSYKSGVDDIYEVARINSYLIMPVGSDRIVALITRVTMKEEIEFNKSTTSITLPTSARYVLATMLGTITVQADRETFIQGVYNFPALDNPVWYVTEKDLIYIFDDKQEPSEIKHDKDFYLPVGTSPAFSNYRVKICPDQFFVKHAAILGNTGSGKSCTLTSIIRNLFEYNYYNDKKLRNAHFVIFDINGEYKDAFLPDTNIDTKTKQQLDQINAYYYGGDGEVKVPYWFMNWDDFKHLLQPSDGTQAPVLNRAIGLAKNEIGSDNQQIIPRHLMHEIRIILDCIAEDLKKRTGKGDFGNWNWKEGNEIMNIGKEIKKYHEDLGNNIIKLSDKHNFNDLSKQDPIREDIRSHFDELNHSFSEQQIASEQNIDMPTWFSYRELCTKFIDKAIQQQEYSSNNRVAEYVSTLRLRMGSFLNDTRMATPLMLRDSEEDNRDILAHYIAFILGDFNRYFKETENNFIKQYNDKHQKGQNNNANTNQISIIDLSLLPFEVLETVAALLGRLIIEFVSHFLPDERGKYPIVIVLEEAQNYISERNDSVAKTVFERIAREGRKYGVSLVVCSQRPSELSKTVLSQCNSFIIHRLQNPEDQQYIRGLISSANADILNQLPIIPQQHAIITGDCVRTPIQVRIEDVDPTPNSRNPKFVERWLTDLEIPYEETCKNWLGNDDKPENTLT